MTKEELDDWLRPRSWRECETTRKTDSAKLWKAQLNLFDEFPTPTPASPQLKQKGKPNRY